MFAQKIHIIRLTKESHTATKPASWGDPFLQGVKPSDDRPNNI